MKEDYFIWPVAETDLSENSVEEAFRKVKKYYATVEMYEEEYRKKVDELLTCGVEAKKILQVLQDKTGQIICYFQNPFKNIEILCQIADFEERMEVPVVLGNFNTIDSGYAWIQKIVFQLRKIELGWPEYDFGDILFMLHERKMSYICLAQIICNCEIIRKIETGGRVAERLHIAGMHKEALLFLMWLDKILPYSEEKIMTFAMTLLDIDENGLAYKELLKYQNPDEVVKEMQMALFRLLQER